MSKAMHAKPFRLTGPYTGRHARPESPRQQADPCGQPWAGLCLPAADSHGIPGLGGYQQYQHGQLAEQAG